MITKMIIQTAIWTSVWFAIGLAPTASGDTHGVSIGLFTEHIRGDDPNYNENNRLVFYTYQTGQTIYVAGKFSNSHYLDSHILGIGKETELASGLSVGVVLGVIQGYGNVLDTNCGDYLICAPVLYAKTGPLTHMLLGPAYNLSVTFEL